MAAPQFSEDFHTMSAGRMKALAKTDAMAPEMRKCVHEFGLPIVRACLDMGISRPTQIRQLVKEIWNGSRQEQQNTGAINSLDVMLAYGVVSSAGLLRYLYDNNLVIVPLSPTREMMDASMAEVSDHSLKCTKEEKHRLRLIAGMHASPYLPK